MARPKAKPIKAADLKLHTCDRMVREGSKKVKCARQFLGADNCPRKNEHLSTLTSGFCNSGWHEGTKATDWKGKPAPTCKFYMTCPCECHDELGKLFELTGSERILVESSGYKPDLGGFVMPDVVPEPTSFIDSPLAAPSDVESPVLVVPAPATVPSFTPTPTGRAARGQLESWVHAQCLVWIVEGYDFHCTPQWISKEIGREQAIDPPSVGAVSAVFDRWTKLGFATIEKKPTRFTGLTVEGKAKGLDRMKAEAKRAEKMSRAEQRRGRLR